MHPVYFYLAYFKIYKSPNKYAFNKLKISYKILYNSRVVR